MQSACVVLYYHLACPAVPNSSTFFHKRHDFRQKLLSKNVCFDFLYNVCLKHVILKAISEILSEMYICLHVKHHCFLSDFNEN